MRIDKDVKRMFFTIITIDMPLYINDINKTTTDQFWLFFYCYNVIHFENEVILVADTLDAALDITIPFI